MKNMDFEDEQEDDIDIDNMTYEVANKLYSNC